jgi:hypothetical protein
MRAVAVLATLVSALLGVIMFLLFNGAQAGASGYRFEQQIAWVSALGISYHVGVDGINVGLVLMGAIVAFAAACVAWEIKEREKEFYILLLVMAGGILGAFASLDLFFFYFLHELALVPTFIMIGVWGRGERKNYATFQITLYLSVGALIALVGLIALYLQSGANTFENHRTREDESARRQRAEFHLPAAAIWIRHSGFALAVPFLGAARLQFRSVADRHAARRRAEEVRPLRLDPHRAAVDAAGRPPLDEYSRLALPGQHPLRRLGGDAAERFEPAHRQFQRGAHGLHFPRHREPESHRRDRRGVCDDRARIPRGADLRIERLYLSKNRHAQNE